MQIVDISGVRDVSCMTLLLAGGRAGVVCLLQLLESSSDTKILVDICKELIPLLIIDIEIRGVVLIAWKFPIGGNNIGREIDIPETFPRDSLLIYCYCWTGRAWIKNSCCEAAVDLLWSLVGCEWCSTHDAGLLLVLYGLESRRRRLKMFMIRGLWLLCTSKQRNRILWPRHNYP